MNDSYDSAPIHEFTHDGRLYRIFDFPIPADLETPSEWIHKFSHCHDANSTLPVLRRLWSGIQAPSVARFAESLCKLNVIGLLHWRRFEFRAESTVAAASPCWILLSKLTRRDVFFGVWGCLELFYVTPDVDTTETDVRLKMSGVSDEVASFASVFHSLRTTLPPYGGFFQRLSAIISVEDGEREKRIGTEWEDGYELFRSISGDVLVVNGTGQTGWLMHETRDIVPFTSNFSEFLDILLEGDLNPPW